MADAGEEKMEEAAEAGGAELDWVEKQRGVCEPDNHWQYRREFLMRNAEAVALAPGDKGGQDSAELRRLVSFSMVWANHVFLGCRYPPQVMEKVMDMAAGITVTNAPAHTLRDELVAKVKRRISSSNEGLEEPCKKRAMAMDKVPEVSSNSKKATSTEILVKKDGEPVKTSGKKATGNPEKQLDSSVAQKVAPVSALPAAQVAPAVSSPVAQKVAPAVSSPVAQKVAPTVSSPVAQKVAPAVSLPVAQKVAPAVSSPVAQEVAPAVSSPVAQKVAPAVSSPVAQKVAPAVSSPVAQKVAPAVSSPVAQKVAPAVSSPVAQKVAPAVSSPVAQKVAPAVSLPVAQKVAPAVSSPVAQKVAPLLSSTGVRIEGVAAHYETTATATHKSVLASSSPSSKSKMNFSSTKHSETKSENVLLPEKKASSEGTTVLASKSTSQTGALPPKVQCKLLTSEDAKERQPFFNRLYKAVAWKLVAAGGFSASVNHVELLNSSIQSVKATLDVEFVPLKELADLPQNKSSQENVVCELRCKSVYLGTGCGKSKENAKAVASREALKLFLKKKVIVKLCKRKYKGKEIEDLVLLDEESKPLNLPPALRNPQEIIAKL